MKTILAISLSVFLLSCSKEKVSNNNNTPPSNYIEMFQALGLQTNYDYSYDEIINGVASGRSGIINFNLSDSIMTETYNSKISQSKFGIRNFGKDYCSFDNPGRGKFSNNESVFINNAWQNLKKQGDSVRIEWSTNMGSYYNYQLLIKK